MESQISIIIIVADAVVVVAIFMHGDTGWIKNEMLQDFVIIHAKNENIYEYASTNITYYKHGKGEVYIFMVPYLQVFNQTKQEFFKGSSGNSNTVYKVQYHCVVLIPYRQYNSSILEQEAQAGRPMVCSVGGIITKTGWALNPGWGNLRRSSRPSWQRAHMWQKTWVITSHADSHCSRCTSSSRKLPQYPHDLWSASQLPCFHRKSWTDL